ncbi:oxidoreductase [Mycobacterium tuberculosis TKK_04_0068]|nr:oxidoreductase [Mycobacterium tuberculosis TKK_04_0068]
MVLGFWDIAVPIVGAPMAGGPSTPALAAAVSNAGGLGFVAGGYLSADRLADDIAAARAATTGPIGANLFVPQPSVADWAQLEYYADELEEVAEYYHTEVGQPVYGDDDDWVRKLEVVADVRPEVVSFTFGAPPPDVVQRLSALGLLVSITVTSVYEAGVAPLPRARTAWWSRARLPAGTAERSRRTWNPVRSRCTNSSIGLAAPMMCRWLQPVAWARLRTWPPCCAAERSPRRLVPHCCWPTKPVPMPHTVPR